VVNVFAFLFLLAPTLVAAYHLAFPRQAERNSDGLAQAGEDGRRLEGERSSKRHPASPSAAVPPAADKKPFFNEVYATGDPDPLWHNKAAS
jgi:hypothetical protein